VGALNRRGTLALGFLAVVLALPVGSATPNGDAKRGNYLARAAGCLGCHTEDKEGAQAYAGGRALKTQFGTFYGPNITPHPQAGIGRWSQADFIRAIRKGERPDGSHYYPAFPYPSFTRMVDDDLRDLWAYLRTLAPSWRFLVAFWKLMFFKPGAFVADAQRPPEINRGAYLVEALGHCGECHTPRNFLGGMKSDRFLGGGKGPDGKRVPNLTPTRLKSWSDGELKDFLLTGMTPDGDVPAEAMAEVIRNTTSQVTADDLSAMVAYLRTVPPVPEEPR
jgi:mono/diheme cytochrome c family protein